MPSSSAKDNEIITGENVIVNTAEQDAAARAKAEWMEGARLAGWSHKGDDALLNSLYDARTDGVGNVITEYGASA